MIDKGKQIYGEVCFACHGDDGRGTPAPGLGTLAPAARLVAARARASGLRDQDAAARPAAARSTATTYPEVMVPMGQNNDEWVAAIASYVRNSFGNRPRRSSPADVARVRAATAARKTPWPYPSSSRRCRA